MKRGEEGHDIPVFNISANRSNIELYQVLTIVNTMIFPCEDVTKGLMYFEECHWNGILD